MATATAMAVVKGVAKDVLYLNAWWCGDPAVATNTDTALFSSQTSMTGSVKLVQNVEGLASGIIKLYCIVKSIDGPPWQVAPTSVFSLNRVSFKMSYFFNTNPICSSYY